MSGMSWGGSEVLWGNTARLLQDDGHQVTANYKWWPEKAYMLSEIERNGGELWFRNKPKSFIEARTAQLKNIFSGGNQHHGPRRNAAPEWLRATRPDAVLITLGYHPDRIHIANDCRELGIPYAINVQCASNFFFLHGDQVPEYRNWYKYAEKVYFVSEENQRKVENNIAMKLTNAEIIPNPFNVAVDADPPYPSTEPKFKIACVGRIHFQSKGQDMIVDVMKQEKWKNRNVEITFFGHDQGQKLQLQELTKQYGLENHLKLGGYKDRVEDIWEENHALLLPSRYEGAPLAVIEAMLCNRVSIVTDIGRNRELMDDGDSGFIAEGPTIELLDRAMERAWEKRDQWEAMGRLAGKHIRERYSKDPIRDLANCLITLAGSKKPATNPVTLSSKPLVESPSAANS